MSASAADNRPCFLCVVCGDDMPELPPEINADVIAAYAAVLKAKSDKVGELMDKTTGGPMLFRCP